MRTVTLALGAVVTLSVVQLACSGGVPASDDATASLPSSPSGGASPSPELASAPVDGGAPAASEGGASSDGGGGASSGGGGASSDGGGGGGASSGGPIDPNAGAGPKPTSTCAVTRDAAGFFTRTGSLGSYVAYVPASYDGTKPTRLIVGLHGCGDTAYNFATWGVNPYDTRAKQDHLGVSIGGQDGNCWTAADDAKVLAAVDDLSGCFWVHQKKVVIAGFSSGGEAAYRVGLTHAARFAGILIEDSGLYAASSDPAALLAGAAWRLPVAHLTHTSDPVFPLAKVKADWASITAAGFPLVTTETPGLHDGTSTDWATWLIPRSAPWTAP